MLSQQPEAQAVAVVQAALAQGIRLLDTAPTYRTEKFVGQALVGVPRDQYVLSTKIGRVADDSGHFAPDYSRDGVLKSLERSLNALKIDHVDILHIHDADHHYEQALNEAFPALADLRSQGVIRAVGAGMNQWQMLTDFARHADFDVFLLAGRYTLLEQTALDALALFREKNIGIFSGGVYNSGILATGATSNARYNYRSAPPDIVDKTRRLEAICTRHNVPLNAAAVQFVSAHPAVTSLVIGADHPDQVAENIRALNVPIPPAFWADLRADGLVDSRAPLPGGA
jgi:D-threo-aldose 1-dehydrogenase